jgi:polyribonucleotide nucleotidyltransferase
MITEPRRDLSKYAPRIYTMTIPTDKIREVIGPGGKVIRGIIEQTGVKIDVERRRHGEHLRHRRRFGQEGHPDGDRHHRRGRVGKTYLGKVVRIVDFGAFVEIFPGTDGLLHISEISENRVKNVRDELKEGDQILVKVLALEGNKIKLSRKAVLQGAARSRSDS